MADRDLTLPTLGTRMRGAARGLGLSDFWQWWRGQLDPLLPQSLRTAVARRRMRPVIVFAGDHATLWRPAVEGGIAVMRAVATIPLATDPAAHASEGSAALAQGADRGSAGRVVVSLAPADVLRRRLTLPLALQDNLRQALAYDLDRHTPFRPDELYFDAAVIERMPQRGTLVADLATARRAVVDPLLRHVAAWGGQVAAVVPDAPDAAARSRLNLLPPEQRTTASAWRRWQFWVPLVAIVLGLVAAIAIPLWNERQEAITLGQDADEARARAAVSETLRAELNAKVADYNAALERKYAFPSALAVLDQVSKILPDDTWLTQFELKTTPRSKDKDVQREIMLRGETANVGKLVQVLEESQMFTQAAQRGTTTKIQPGPGEIFDLGAQLRPKAAPTPRNVSVSGTHEPAPAAGPATATPTTTAAPPTPAAAPQVPAAAPAAASTTASAPASGAATPAAASAPKATATPASPPTAASTPAAPTGSSTPVAGAAPGAPAAAAPPRSAATGPAPGASAGTPVAPTPAPGAAGTVPPPGPTGPIVDGIRREARP